MPGSGRLAHVEARLARRTPAMQRWSLIGIALLAVGSHLLIVPVLYLIRLGIIALHDGAYPFPAIVPTASIIAIANGMTIVLAIVHATAAGQAFGVRGRWLLLHVPLVALASSVLVGALSGAVLGAPAMWFMHPYRLGPAIVALLAWAYSHSPALGCRGGPGSALPSLQSVRSIMLISALCLVGYMAYLCVVFYCLRFVGGLWAWAGGGGAVGRIAATALLSVALVVALATLPAIVMGQRAARVVLLSIVAMVAITVLTLVYGRLVF
jgi:hypothetical protein